MKWITVTNDLIKEGEYIVKTKTMFGWNVLKSTIKYDEKGKPSWSCKNQIVTHYLSEN